VSLAKAANYNIGNKRLSQGLSEIKNSLLTKTIFQKHHQRGVDLMNKSIYSSAQTTDELGPFIASTQQTDTVMISDPSYEPMPSNTTD
jgi:hypothetical protein